MSRGVTGSTGRHLNGGRCLAGGTGRGRLHLRCCAAQLLAADVPATQEMTCERER
jgi:hypothetical protein